MAHKYTWDKLVKNAYRLNPKSRGHRYPYTPKFEVSAYTSGPNRGQKVIVPFVGTKSVLISLRAWGVTQASLHNVTMLFSEVDIQKQDPHSTNYFQIQYEGEMYWIRKLDKFKNPLTARCTCFTGDTKVLLADGTSKTFKELEKEEEFELFSYDYINNKIVVSKAGNSRLIKQNAPIIELIFNDNSKLKCTPDHKTYLKNGQLEFACNLLNKTVLTKSGKDLIVTDIKEVENEDVYCLTNPEFGNFCVQVGEDGVVEANCADFFFTFAWYNYHNAHCLYGPAPRPYQKKTNRPPRNPQGIPGVCKHIYNAWEILRNSGLTIN